MVSGIFHSFKELKGCDVYVNVGYNSHQWWSQSALETAELWQLVKVAGDFTELVNHNKIRQRKRNLVGV